MSTVIEHTGDTGGDWYALTVRPVGDQYEVSYLSGPRGAGLVHGTELRSWTGKSRSAVIARARAWWAADEAAANLRAARTAVDDAMAASIHRARLLISVGYSEASAARDAGIDRMTLRKALGKR